MLHKPLAIVAVMALAGCSASTSFNPQSRTSTREEESAQLAAYAATTEFPAGVRAQENMRAAAIIDPRSSAIRVYNFSEKPLTSGNVWVNGTYVQRFNSVPARGYVTLDRSRFYDRTGTSLGSVNVPVNTVQLQFDNDLYDVLGPVYQ